MDQLKKNWTGGCIFLEKTLEEPYNKLFLNFSEAYRLDDMYEIHNTADFTI